MLGSDSGFAARVKAVLGPTNTGKTHLAIERLLAHSSGIIGFPLRLLARENYDRMVAIKGARYVALITGEEKIIPPDARWFSCTVEAMPLDRHTEFVAVDEIQLCADPDRGHVFTDRLLHARGMVETMFLGAETIAPLIRHLVPSAQIETRPRLSQLSYAGPAKLVRLPPRTAVVAFSAAEIYALAELIRRRKGGCAVVMGRLSPRTRNAQVALYQEREVDFLVATDAIGMGLNMNVDHVAFAGLGKFDGHRPRRLTASEVAQIAGRAGRGMKDGTFGTTTECPSIPDEVVAAVEAHSFDSLETLCWRNSDLDFASLDSLIDSLNAPPPRPGLMRGNEASDLETLTALSRDPDIRKLANGRRRMRLLWDSCQIPDFRKLADDTHAKLCARVFGHVATDTYLPTDWLAAQIAGLDRADGDIDTLMQRLSGVRVWSYIAARSDWVKDTVHWQARAREVEDKLSDALHESLTSRFVDRRSAMLMRRLDEAEGKDLLSAVTRRGEVVVEGHDVGRIEGFGFVPDPLAVGDEKKLVLRAARRALRDEMPRRVGVLEVAADDAFGLTADHRLTWDGVPVAKLVPGSVPLRPRVQVLDSEFLDGAERERVRGRLQTWLDGRIRADLAPLFAAETLARSHPALRGPLHRLMESLGLIPGVDEETLSAELRPRLRALGVRSGRFALFMPALMKPRSAEMRARLWALHHGVRVPTLPAAALVSVPVHQPDWPAGFAAMAGWVEAGPILLRLDIAEKIAGELGYRSRRGPAALPSGLASRFAIKPDMVPAVLRPLGFRVLPAVALHPDAFGPPAPAMLMPLRRRKPLVDVPAPVRVAGGPFAALAALKRGGAR
ncbi:helicase-related protein [Acidisphaera sp. S103]|uniref:helicase-related protein n=1 Tax=Acidisphaera sp. S103 TaxID=1747223 RepID=UPI00131C988F|nr:helicase-related protein [Acidisphaera sp. S103]